MDEAGDHGDAGSRGAPPPPETIAASGEKALLGLLGSAAFTAIGVWMVNQAALQTRINGWFVLVFFGLCAAVFAGLLLRPQRLLLDPGGFTVSGGLVRTPRRVGWREIDGFFLYAVTGASHGVGYTMAAPSGGSRINRAVAGVDAALPQGWPLSPPEMVDRLNRYRARALSSG